MKTQTYTGTLVVTCCYKCGTYFGMPRGFYDDRLRDRKNFHCPAGHAQHFTGENEAERYKRQAEQANRRAAAAEGRAERAARSRAAYKGQLTKTKNRIANGVCPCCNRTFEDLARHMKSKHPDYAPTLRVVKRGTSGPWYNIIDIHDGRVVTHVKGKAAAYALCEEMTDE